MNGLKKLSIGNSSVIVLESVTDEIKQTLKERLSDYCYGRVQSGESADYYSFENTVEEFFRLYDTKPRNARVGLAGELMIHLLLPHGHASLDSACVFLNKEEYAVKKGFDLTFYDRVQNEIWYGEVKSGDVAQGSDANAKARERIGEAERSLEKMFTTDIERKRWDAAVTDASLALESNDANKVKDLLRTDFTEIRKDADKKVQALLCAVVMHPIDISEIDAMTGEDILSGVLSRKRYKDVRLLLVQQSDLETIVSVLRSSLSGSH